MEIIQTLAIIELMKPIELPAPDEIRTAYQQGEAAVLAMFEKLAGTVRALEDKIQVLEDQLAKDSHNSSKPPASDGLKRGAKRSLRHSSGKANGGQVGHALHRLEKVSKPKYVKVHSVSQCDHCQASLEDVKVDAAESQTFEHSSWQQ